MTNTKDPSNHSRDIAAKLAESPEIWQAIDDARRQTMPGAEDALARIVQLVRDEQIRALAVSLVSFADEVDDHPDFSIVEVKPMGTSGRDLGDYYMVTARMWGPVERSGEIWGGQLTSWLGFLAVDGSLTCAGWDSADQWVDARVDRVLGTSAAVALGERILAAAVRS